VAVDALIVGAGPVGLFAAFQFGLLGMRCALVDALPFAGGQTVQLYADKPIYDIPGIPVCMGRELTERLLVQIQPFGTALHLGLQVSGLQAAEITHDGGQALPGYRLQTTRSDAPSQPGPEFAARVVCITAGVGAFVPRPLPGLPPEALAPYDGRSVHWLLDTDGAAPAGPHVIAGGGPEAVQAAIRLAQGASAQQPVTIVHRRDVLQADEPDLQTVAGLRASGLVQVVAGQISSLAGQGDALASLTIATPDGQSQTLPAAHLWVLQGLSPRLGPLADWGMALAKRQVAVDPAHMATSLPGVFAAGDVVSYAGKRRLIVCGFHEATLAAYAASDLLLGGETPVQYTTTSPELQRRLGVLHDGN
jgi:thioredoxin reductase (NADPH)